MSITDNLKDIKSRLPSSCKLIAVSKTYPPEIIQEAYNAGQRTFGENKVQELMSKVEKLPADIEWHLIGHLQTNKVRYIAPVVSLIHSVDSMKLLLEIDKQGRKTGRRIACLLQVHIAREETKFGFLENEIRDLAQSEVLAGLEHVEIVGLMGMASLTDDSEQIRAEFRGLKILFEALKSLKNEKLNMRELSMGMSSDFHIAVEEGSTMVRVGSVIFGRRDYQTKKTL